MNPLSGLQGSYGGFYGGYGGAFPGPYSGLAGFMDPALYPGYGKALLIALYLVWVPT
jgi:hypothetical protein